MSLKDTATRMAVLTALADLIGDELKTAKAELQQELAAAKKETGTQKVSVSLPDGRDVGSATLVQPKATAQVIDPAAFLAWVRTVAKTEITSRIVTEVRPAWLDTVLKEMTAAGAARWCDRETGEVHDVPGVAIRGRSAYTRLTLPDEGREAIAEAWRSGALAGLALPQITAAPEAAEAGTEAAA